MHTHKAKPVPAVDPNKLIECPICLEFLSAPITYCEAGHSMCKKCFDGSRRTRCPICQGPMAKHRHVGFEQLLESVRTKLEESCRYAHKGCKLAVTAINKDDHEQECRYRVFKCEGKMFAGWKCDWYGEYEHLENHFKAAHPEKTVLKYIVKDAAMKINFTSSFKDVHFISFYEGQAYFYYKHFVDVEKEKIYWLFQYIGLKAIAKHFIYEFEIFNGPVRKFKVTEICYNDSTRTQEIFETEKCVVMSFATAKNFLNNEGELPFRYRILKPKVTA